MPLYIHHPELRRLKSHEQATQFYSLIWLSQIHMTTTHRDEYALHSKKYQTWQVFFSQSYEVEFSQKRHRTWDETAEQVALQFAQRA